MFELIRGQQFEYLILQNGEVKALFTQTRFDLFGHR